MVKLASFSEDNALGKQRWTVWSLEMPSMDNQPTLSSCYVCREAVVLVVNG
jgi:hypothetical protein